MAFSGGKDSIACLLTLLERGVPPDRIELVHHEVDGGADSFMDLPCTTAYCQAIASALRLPLYLSWKEGGFLREMLREDAPTAPIQFQVPSGAVARIGGARPRNTRLAYPQGSPDLKVRWCSAYLKIDVMAALIHNQERFLGRRTRIVTGESAQESAARSRYPVFEPHRSDTRGGTRRPRHVDHWGPIHGLDEHDVRDMLCRHGIVPAPAYRLGWSRLSCLGCIFGSADQWASVRHIAPDRFARIAAYDRQFRRTIHRELSVEALADRGRPFPALVAQPRLASLAMRSAWTQPVNIHPTEWTLPAGAFGCGAGPT